MVCSKSIRLTEQNYAPAPKIYSAAPSKYRFFGQTKDSFGNHRPLCLCESSKKKDWLILTFFNNNQNFTQTQGMLYSEHIWPFFILNSFRSFRSVDPWAGLCDPQFDKIDLTEFLWGFHLKTYWWYSSVILPCSCVTPVLGREIPKVVVCPLSPG